MLEVRLTYTTSDGPQEISIDSGKISFGRSGDVDHQIDDDGLSRHHATVYREDDNVWIVDENSTNGTFVNGEAVAGAGRPLGDGDIIRIGNHTNIRVTIDQAPVSCAPSPTATPQLEAARRPSSGGLHILPIALIAGAIFIISVTSVLIGFTVLGSSGPTVVERPDHDPGGDERGEIDPKTSPTTKTSSTPVTGSSPIDNSPLMTPEPGNDTKTSIPSGKKYFEMTDAERRQYLEAKAMRVAQIIGNNNSEQIPAAAIDKIKAFADSYASRAKARVRTGTCGFSDNLQATFERASKNAPFIIRAFNEKGMDPRIGLYLAMIESEHCVCLQSPTGPLGMFQFTRATAALHGLKVFAGASPSNPDERCQPEPAARAAASYMKALTGRYGTGPSSVPLAIGSYNSGEGGLSSNLEKALSSGQGLPRDFWTLIAKGEILSKQFQAENFKYVPKFFAAAIIGENPQDFGLNLQPISTYSK
jgi:hypothetical protein